MTKVWKLGSPDFKRTAFVLAVLNSYHEVIELSDTGSFCKAAIHYVLQRLSLVN